MKRKKDSMAPFVVMVVIVLVGILGGRLVMGATYQKRIQEYFAGSTLDSGRVNIRTGADSTGSYRLTLDGDSTAIDSVIMAVPISDTAISYLTYKLYFFGQDVEGFEQTIPPMFPRVSGGAVDSNRTEQGGAGSGTYIIDYFLWDTLGGDTTAVSGWSVTAKPWNNLDGSPAHTVSTGENGAGRISTDADSLAFLAPSGLYTFPTAYDSQTWVANDTFNLYGYLNVPEAAPGAHSVTIYLDATGGLVDSATGAVIPRDRLKFKLSLVGERGLNDGGWGVFPKTEEKKVSSTGRVSFTVIANTPLTPAGSYYSLRYEAKDGQSTLGGPFKKFIVDTLTDPINILDCTETD